MLRQPTRDKGSEKLEQGDSEVGTAAHRRWKRREVPSTNIMQNSLHY